MENLGLRLKLERKRLGLSQRSFGKIGGVEPNAQGKYESGARLPKSDYLQKISAAGVDIQYVLNGTVGAVHGYQFGSAAGAPGLKLPDNGNPEFGVIVTSLLAQLRQNLHLTAQAISDVVDILAKLGPVEHQTDLERLLSAYHADFDKFVAGAISRATLSQLNE